MPDVRLIDANAIVEKLQSYYESLSHDVYSELIRRDEVSSCIAELINAPTIDAQPVKRGKWETKGGVHCTRCGWRPTGRICDLFTAYCAGCGAKMS
jgi:hypothetical protein